jgi:hypothetical protein
MWEKIKKWFGFADANRDGKLTAEDLEFAKALAEVQFKAANEKINDQITDAVTQVNNRVEHVKEEVTDVVEAAKEVVEQVEDVVAAVKGKTRKGRKKK